MSYNAPDLATVLANEQTLSTRLSNLQTLLKEILDDVGVVYEDNSTINELIDLFVYVKQYYWQTASISTEEDEAKYGGKYYSEVIRPKLSDVIEMKNISYAAWNNAGDSTVRGKFRLSNVISSVNTHSAVFGCFKNDEKVTLLSANWVMKIGFIPQIFSSFSGSNLVGVGILISGSGDTVSSGSSDYCGAFVGISKSGGNLYPASATVSNGATPESVSHSDQIVASGSKYYVELTNDSSYNRIVVKFYDDNDNLIHSENIAYSSIYGSNSLVQSYKIFFGAIIYGMDSSRYSSFPNFVITDGYVDVDV